MYKYCNDAQADIRQQQNICIAKYSEGPPENFRTFIGSDDSEVQIRLGTEGGPPKYPKVIAQPDDLC